MCKFYSGAHLYVLNIHVWVNELIPISLTIQGRWTKHAWEARAVRCHISFLLFIWLTICFLSSRGRLLDSRKCWLFRLHIQHTTHCLFKRQTPVSSSAAPFCGFYLLISLHGDLTEYPSLVPTNPVLFSHSVRFLSKPYPILSCFVVDFIYLYLYKRTLTFSRMETLTIEVVIDRLVLRKHFFLAIRICQFLHIHDTEGVSRILAHWACYKVRYFKFMKILFVADLYIRGPEAWTVWGFHWQSILHFNSGLKLLFVIVIVLCSVSFKVLSDYLLQKCYLFQWIQVMNFFF